jgi:hypothetical protein
MTQPSSFLYQWNRDGVAVSGATSSTYTVAVADVGGTLTCTVTAADSAGSTAATSSPTGTVGAQSYSVLGAEAVAGTGGVSTSGYLFGSVYKATSSGASVHFRFYGRGGASSQIFTPALYSTADGSPSTLLGTGAPVTVTAGAPAQWWTSAVPNVPIVSGESYALAVLSGDTSAQAELYSVAGTGTNYYFQTATITPNWATPGSTQSATWIFAVDYAPISAVPTNSTAPVIEAAPAIGSMVSASPGTWTNAPTSYSYQWNRISSGSSAPIGAATSAQYLPVNADLGLALTVTVVGTNSIGPSAAVTSAPSAAVVPAPVAAAGVTFVPPADSGMINVVTAGADNKGNTDCTALLQSLISAHLGVGPYYSCALYFPAGTYKISSTLRAIDSSGTYRPQLALRGENESTTTIKMEDGVWPGTSDYSEIPYGNGGYINSGGWSNSMVYWSTYGATSGNNAFNNYCMDLTFDLGNNPGGGCMGFLVNNVGGVRRCRFSGTAGFIGIDLGRGITGPGIITDCTFDPDIFAMPIITYGQDYSYIIERCTVGASTGSYSLQNSMCIGIKDSTFAQPVYTDGAATDTTFWSNTGTYPTSKTDGSGGRVQMLGPGVSGFKLSSVDTPLVAYDPVSEWVNAATYTGGLQGALNSGKSTVYIPANAGVPLSPGTTIPASVNRIICFGNGPSPTGWSIGTPFFISEGTSSTPLTFEWCTVQSDSSLPTGTDQNNYVYLQHNSTRDVVFLDWSGNGIVQGTSGGGRIFGDNFFMRVNLVAGNHLYARQWNWEDPFIPCLVNSGGQAWIFGLKTEWGCQVPGSWATYGDCYAAFRPTLTGENGGRTDMCVGFSFPNSGQSGTPWAQYVFTDASFALSNIDFVPGGDSSTQNWLEDVSSSPAATIDRVANPNTQGTRLNAYLSYNGA